MSADLSRRATGGLVSLLLGQGGQVVVQLVTLPILARLVAPESFGLVAAALVVVNAALLLASVGLTTSLVQVRDLEARHVRVAFTIQVTGAVVVFGLVALGAESIAALVRLPELTAVLRLMALAYFIRALTVGDAVLRRELRFRALAIIELVAYLVGFGGVTVVAAAAGHGVWALAWGHLAAAVLHTSIMWLVAPHPARPSLSARHRRALLGTGVGYTLSQAGYQVAHEVDNLIVGRWLGAGALGLYERSYRLMRMPAAVIGHVLGEVLYPAMATVQDEQDRVRHMFAVSTVGLAVLTLPLTVVVWLVADELVLVLLGADWLALRDVLEVMVLGMYPKAAESVTDSAIVASGAVYKLATRRWMYAASVIVGALVGQRWGLRGVAVGALAAMTLNSLVLVRLSLTLVGMSWREFARLHRPALVLALVAGVGCLGAAVGTRAATTPAIVTLLAGVVGAGIAIVVACRAALRWSVYEPLLELLRLVELLLTAPRARRLARVVLGPQLLEQPPRQEVVT